MVDCRTSMPSVMKTDEKPKNRLGIWKMRSSSQNHHFQIGPATFSLTPHALTALGTHEPNTFFFHLSTKYGLSMACMASDNEVTHEDFYFDDPIDRFEDIGRYVPGGYHPIVIGTVLSPDSHQS